MFWPGSPAHRITSPGDRLRVSNQAWLDKTEFAGFAHGLDHDLLRGLDDRNADWLQAAGAINQRRQMSELLPHSLLLSRDSIAFATGSP